MTPDQQSRLNRAISEKRGEWLMVCRYCLQSRCTLHDREDLVVKKPLQWCDDPALAWTLLEELYLKTGLMYAPALADGNTLKEQVASDWARVNDCFPENL